MFLFSLACCFVNAQLCCSALTFVSEAKLSQPPVTHFPQQCMPLSAALFNSEKKNVVPLCPPRLVVQALNRVTWMRMPTHVIRPDCRRQNDRSAGWSAGLRSADQLPGAGETSWPQLLMFSGVDKMIVTCCNDTLKALASLYACEESVDWAQLSSFCDDSNLHIPIFK